MANRTFKQIFHSITELGETVDDYVSTNKKRPHGNVSTDTDRPAFYGFTTMAEAIAIAKSGGFWEKGLNKMPSIEVVQELMTNRHEAPQQIFQNDVTGFMPLVPNYLNNQPDAMLSSYETHDAPLLKVAVHVGRIADIGQYATFNRGIAILAVLDDLVKRGYNIELWALWRNREANTTCSIETRIKNSDESWSLSNIAFALCHVAFQRRLCWRVAESLRGGSKITQHSYGNGIAARYPDFDIHFKYMTEEQPFADLETAVMTIDKLTQEQIKRLNRKTQQCA